MQLLDDVSITGRTAVLAILGDPLEQARAPGLVNAALAERGQDAVLVPFRVARGALAPVIAGLRAVETFRGAVVTMPHKAAVVGLLDEVSAEARQLGACNVIRREPDGRLAGTMLDGEGFTAALGRTGFDVRGKRVFLAGAGGAAAAIAFAMAKYGAAALAVHNRTVEKARDLAARVHAAYPATDPEVTGPRPAGHDLVINATSLGMRAGDALPLDPAGLEPGTVAAEIVIHPETTPFLAAAAARGCTVQRGLPMLVEQIDQMIAFMLGPCDGRSAH
jgi:shikimate dehydrogenase